MSKRITFVVVIVVPLLVLAVGAWHYRWMSDDGFINLRVVRQIEAGHGPVFNRGERVEAATSPLWVAVLTVADVVLPMNLEWIAVLLGMLATLAGVGLVLWGALRLLPERPQRALVLPTGIWILVAFAPMWKFASSGLENGLFTVWFGASFALLARWATSDRTLPGWATAVVLGLAPLIRPDVALIAAALLVAVVVAARASWVARLRFLAVALALPVAFELFRMGYYDSLVPNTAIAKEASRSWWSHGFTYVRVAGQPYWIWIPLLAVAGFGYVPMLRGVDARRRAVVVACAAGGLLHLLYVARVGGDFMHARMVLPGLTAIVAHVAVSIVDRTFVRIAMPVVVGVWAVVAIGVLRSADDAQVTFIGNPRNAITLADYGWQKGGPQRAWDKGPGVYFIETPVGQPARAGLPPTVQADFGVGISSYALGAHAYVLDMLGLGDAFTAHLKLAHRGVIAHEKPLPLPWVAARLFAPTAQLAQSDFPMPAFFIARPLDHPVGTFDERVAAARRALTCGELRSFTARVSDPLSLHRFFGNLVHAPADTQLRIPPEPADAVAKYCG